MSELDDLTESLSRLAVRLREEELSPDAAAELVEECSRLAAAAAAELDRQARAALTEQPTRADESE